ncbi:phosphatase PAP2 family protein [Pseudodesulfovibrio sp. F-1]|uniref:Phosphatase PAP2 family protein n=1 Tax=Pseudodesulfovibrio alkaliphilus TaxID=2661613 RepID=A0A7K1KJL8_9BACT|nr:phosphatase PAP2 family protein [Pseudodesulfovibrio alkaliphilus]MUM76277.1 phosphatase PAP2 family protein [Pseudodesulfovibrio alkaliphilus]
MRIFHLRHLALLSAPLLFLLAALWLVFPSEEAVAGFFQEHREAHPGLTLAFTLITDWCNPVFYGLFGWVLFRAWRSGDRETLRFMGILVAVQAVVAGLAVHFVKHTVGRPRPGQGVWFDPITTRGAFHSLPSGHTTEFMGWAVPFALRLGRTGLTVLTGVAAALVGLSRVYLGWHHPSDVFFGWMLGSFGGMATMVLADSSLFRKKG